MIRTEETVSRAVAASLGAQVIDSGTSLDVIDSLELVALILEMEIQFDISLPNEKRRGMKTFGDLVKVIEAA